MSARAKDDGPHAMGRAEYHAWAARQPRGRFERVDGQVVAMAPERLGHALVKGRVWRALDDALVAAAVRCEAIPDGATVEIGDDTDYEPDVVIARAETLDLDSTVAPTPVVVVEVTSPSTGSLDTGGKLADYFRVPSVQHYLIVSARRKQAIHHARSGDGIATRIIGPGGLITLDPPGIAVALDAFYARLDL